MAKLGAKGGKAKGARKKRGGRGYYSRIGKLGAQKRKK